MGEVRSMNEDSPNDSPYEMLAKHNQSETKRDKQAFMAVPLVFLQQLLGST
jgi:hypothetical protein